MPRDHLKHSGNKLLRILYEYMEEKKLDSTAFSKLVGVNENTLFSKDGGFPSNPAEQGPFTRIMIARFFLILGIDPEKFLLTQGEEEEWFDNHPKAKRQKYFTRAYWEELKGIRSINSLWIEAYFFNNHDRKENEKLNNAYEQISRYFLVAKENIEVHELLAKGDNRIMTPYKAYQDAQKKIFEAILVTTKENTKEQEPRLKPFKYTRIFYLSRTERLFGKKKRSHCVQAFVVEASKETLLHIKHCWHNHRDYCRFLIAKAKNYRHHVIIDDRYILTEDYAIHDDSVVPERLTVIDVAMDEKGEMQMKMIKNHAMDHREIYDISEGEIMESLISVQKFIQGQIEIRDSVIKEYLNKNSDKAIWLRQKLRATSSNYKKQLEKIDEKMNALKEFDNKNI